MAATPVTTIQTELSDLGGDLVQIGAFGIGIGASVFALKKGWKVVKGFVS